MNVIREYAKSIAVVLVGIIGNAVTDLVNGTAPWPQTGAEWVRWATTTLGAGMAAWAFPNRITQKQLDKDPGVPPGVVLLPDTPQPTFGSRVDPTTKPDGNPWL